MAKSKKNVANKPSATSIEEAYKEALARFSHRRNVTGIDIGFKETDGKKTKERSIRLHVKEKLPKSALEAAEIFPEQIKGFPVDVIQANYKAGLQMEPALEITDRSQRFSSIQPGISIGHRNVTAGTLGMMVRDNRSGKMALLSNWHVLAGDNTANPGDDIVQPGPHDGGRIPRDTIAKLERMILDQDGDAAIALLTHDRPFIMPILDLNVVPETVQDPEDGDIVVKSGRTTQVTKGKVDGKGRYFIDYPVGRVGIDGFRITTTDAGNPGNIEISRGGDSGSVWMIENSNKLAGLHFAGETDSRPEEEHAIACFASKVFSRLNISLVPAGEAERKVQPIFSQALPTAWGSNAVSHLLEQLDARQIRLWSRHLEKNYPRLMTAEGMFEEMDHATPAELGPLGVVSIGFAAGAAARLLKDSNCKATISEEVFSLMISAFLSGALAGSKAVEGRLP